MSGAFYSAAFYSGAFYTDGGPIPPVPVAQQPFQGAGQGLSEDRAFWDKVNAAWDQIDSLREQQKQKQVAQARLQAEQDLERQRIHERMAELRSTKARKKSDRERIKAEIAALQQEEEAYAQQLANEMAVIHQMSEIIDRMIMEIEDYQHRYKAALTMLLLSVD